MGRGPGTVTSLHGPWCLMHVIHFQVCAEGKEGGDPPCTPLLSNAEHKTSLKRPLILLCGCPTCEKAGGCWEGCLGSGSVLPGPWSPSTSRAGRELCISVHVVFMGRRSWLTAAHRHVHKRDFPQTLRLAPEEAFRLPTKCGHRNLLLATHWLPRVWWLCWGQVEVRIG